MEYWVLLYDSQFKDFKGKLCTRWLGPYKVDTVFDDGTVKLVTVDSAKMLLLANGHQLRLYHQPTSKESFVNIVVDFDLHVTIAWEHSPMQPKNSNSNKCGS